MARIWNKRNRPTEFSPKLSFGPFAVAGDELLFDLSSRQPIPWLGFNASTSFGVLHHLESWTGKKTHEHENLQQAYQWLLKRCTRSLAGRLNLKNETSISPGELFYQYICLSVLDQFADSHQQVANSIEQKASNLFQEFSSLINGTRIDPSNFQFGFSFADPTHMDWFENIAPSAGILIDRPNSKDNEFTFQMSLSYDDEKLNAVFQRIRFLMNNTGKNPVVLENVVFEIPAHLEEQYNFHKAVIESRMTGELPIGYSAREFLQRNVDLLDSRLSVQVIDASNYPEYRDQILAMQTLVYEPVRRTPPAEFDMLFASEKPLAILVLDNNQIVAMTFAGQLGLFKQERGVAEDPWLNDNTVYYSMDLTVAPTFRGGLGRTMKQAQLLLAIENGVSAIHGRNRDRLAGAMWAINLSLGSYELQNLKDDYPDDGEFRDCIYYRCPIRWERDFNTNEITRIKDAYPALISGLRFDKPVIEL